MFTSIFEENEEREVPIYAETENLILSEEQEKAVIACEKFLNSDDKYFVVSGCAGTGKSAIIPFIREKVKGECLVAAYTGKAVVVLKRKGVKDAQTLHSLLYIATKKEDANGKIYYEFTPKNDYAFYDTKCVIVDEASMVDKEMFELLVSHRFKIIFIGDHFQLPPIKDNFNIMSKPNIILTKILRQNEDNPIVKLANMARNGQRIPFGQYDNSFKKKLFKLKPDNYLEYNEIITWTNKMRVNINNSIRKIKGYDSFLPQIDEKVIVKSTSRKYGIYNGQMMYVTDSQPYSMKEKICKLSIIDELAMDDIIAAATYSEINHLFSIAWEKEKIEEYRFKKFEKGKKRIPLIHLDYGYAITCHSAQGSSWRNVCVIEENGLKKMDYYNRWLYTAITRAEESVTIFSDGE